MSNTKKNIIGTRYRFLITFILICINFLFCQSNISYENSWGVVVGINDYKNDDIPDLIYATDDAQDIREMLIEYYGFPPENIAILLNEEATAFNIKKQISGLAKKTKENDRIVIFYAGHGMTEDLPGGGEAGYLVPYDGDLEDLYLSSIPMKELKNLSDRFDARHVLFLVDACYGGLAAVGTRGLSSKIPGYYDKVFRGKARQIITAGGKGETVIEKAEWGHSAFTRNVLRGLEDWMADLDNDGYITGEELGMYLKRNVTEDSELHQTPTVARFSTDQGEFMFSRPKKLGGVAMNMNDTSPAVSEPRSRLTTTQFKPSVKPPVKSFSTAKKLSFIFPGMGHLYLGETKPGLIWAGAGTASLAATIGMYFNYQSKGDLYSTASDTYVNFKGAPSDFNALYDEMVVARDNKTAAQRNFIISGTVYLGVVVTNYFILNSKTDHDYSSNNKITGGINSKGQVFINYTF